MGWRDEWLSRPDGNQYGGKQLMELVRNDNSPFHGVWDVKLLIQEIEESLVDKGSNNYGFHLKTTTRPDMVARRARGDVNMPHFEGFSIEKQVPETLFEAATYELLPPKSDIRASHLLYYRVPAQHSGPRLTKTLDLIGRRLFVFERAEGVNNWIHVSECKIKATIQNQDDMIGWNDDEETVGPIALAAKRSLLCAIPHIMPPENIEMSLYRLVLEHGDFVPAILFDPLEAAGPVDLTTDGEGRSCVTRIPKNSTSTDLETYALWARHYIKVSFPVSKIARRNGEQARIPQKLSDEEPDFEISIKAGKDVRHLWFALRNWRGGNSEKGN